ncbi:hypothetical protein [Rubritalea marina]|uniref:hypothetical protein n=1 Tax=Rubritalea marina TaxID=361055 RepID=UPI000378B5D5|nr:hypothetical protein [Rubritalea marina]
MIRSLVTTGSLLLATPIAVVAASQQAPEPVRLLLQADQVLLDAQSQTVLSQYLCDVAAQQLHGTPRQRRNAYKGLVLAQQIGTAPKTIEALGNQLIASKSTEAVGNFPATPAPIKRMLKYLRSSKRSPDNIALASLCDDILRRAQDSSLDMPDSSYWLETIPSEESFDPSAQEQKTAQEEELHVDEQAPESKDPDQNSKDLEAEDESSSITGKWHILESSLSLVHGHYSSDEYGEKAKIDIVDKGKDSSKKNLLYQLKNSSSFEQESKRNLRFAAADSVMRLSSESIERSNHFLSHFQSQAKSALQQYGQDIDFATITLLVPDNYNYIIYGSTTTTSMISKLDLSLNNKFTSRPYIVYGEFDADGKLIIDANFWSMIHELHSNEVSQMVFVPSDALDLLEQSKTLGYSSLFLQHDIIGVKDIHGVRQYLIESDEGADAEAAELFEQIREVVRGRSVNAMLKNKFVQQKLNKVVALNPQQLSAATLQQDPDEPEFLDAESVEQYWTQLIYPLEVWMETPPLPEEINEDDELNRLLDARITPDQIIASLEEATSLTPITVKNRYRDLYKDVDHLINALNLYSKLFDNDRSLRSRVGKSRLEGQRSIKEIHNRIQVTLSSIDS